MSALSPEVLAALGEVVPDAPVADVPVAASEPFQDAPEASDDATPPEAPPAPSKASQDAAKAMEVRMQKEREFRQAEAAARAASAEARKERQELEAYKAELAEARKLRTLAKEDPNAFLKATGHSFEQMATDLAMGKTPTKADEAMQRVAELEQRLAQREAIEQQREVEQKYSNVKQDVTAMLRSKATEYELIVASEAFEDVLDEAQAHFDKTGEIDVDGAAARVEKDLESLIDRIKSTSKYKQRVPSDATESVPAQLTNRQTQQVKSRNVSAETAEERKERAIAAL